MLAGILTQFLSHSFNFDFLLRSNTRSDIIKIISINIVSLIAVLPYCLHMVVRLTSL